MRADRISFAELFLFMLMMVNTLRLNNHWIEQHQTISSGIFGRLEHHSSRKT